MSSLLNLLQNQLGDREVGEISRVIDADPESTRNAIGAALPILLAGLARNSNASGERAESLNRALENDHDGSLLDNLGPLLGMAGALLGGGGGGAMPSRDAQPRSFDGAGILEHILGGRRETVEKGVGKASGLDTAQIAKLLPLLAPIVMAALGRMKREENLDAGSLAKRLDTDRREIERDSGLGGVLGRLLDADGDGSVIDDLGRLITRR